jgi:hypothetical protein
MRNATKSYLLKSNNRVVPAKSREHAALSNIKVRNVTIRVKRSTLFTPCLVSTSDRVAQVGHHNNDRGLLGGARSARSTVQTVTGRSELIAATAAWTTPVVNTRANSKDIWAGSSSVVL